MTFYFLDFDARPSDLLSVRLIVLIVSTLSIAAGGYMLNDHYDRETDSINKPQNQPILSWRTKVMWRTYLVLTLVAVLGGYYIGIRWMLLFAIISVTLWWYSYYLKRLPFIGNLLISLFAFVSIYIVYDVFHSQSRVLVLFYASLAALFTLLREIAKDIEDMEGDASTSQLTFPVIAGFLPAKSLLTSATVFTAVLYASFQYRWLIDSFEGKLQIVFVGYQVICILLPIAYLLFLIFKANTSRDMRKISRIFKYVMATGMLSMAFF